jgi:hypothetical protein
MSIRHQKDILFTALAGLISAGLACIVLYDHFVNHRLIGNLDIWFYHWQAEDFRLWFSQEILHNTTALYDGQIAYPVDNPSGYAGSSWALGLPYLLSYSLFQNPSLALLAVIVWIIGMNAAAAYGLSRSLRIDHVAAFCIGCCWSLSQFMWANIENINAFYAWPGLIALALLIQLVRKHSVWATNRRYAVALAIGTMLTLQLFASIYLLLFSCILLVSILIYHGRHRKKLVGLLHPLLITCVVFICGFIVYAFQRAPVPDYLFDADHLSALKESIELHSISFPKDYLRVNHHNGLGVEVLENPWQQGSRSAFFGFTPLIVLALSVFLAIRKGRYAVLRPYFLVLVGFILISSGLQMQWFGYTFQSPIGFMSDFFPKLLVVRHWFRAHTVVIFISLLLGLLTLSILLDRSTYRRAILLAYMALFMLENLSFNLPQSLSLTTAKPPVELGQWSKQHPEASAILLPSCPLPPEDVMTLRSPINQVNREMIYGAWQTQLNLSIVNGGLAYYPPELIPVGNAMCSCSQGDSLTESNMQKLVIEARKLHVDYLLIHPKLSAKGDIANNWEAWERYALQDSSLATPNQTGEFISIHLQ